MKNLSVIVPIYGSKQKLKNFLSAYAFALDDYSAYELIIVDDSSPENLWSTFEDFIRDKTEISAKFIRNSQNLGRAASRNKGLSVAKGEIIVFVDVDNLPGHGAFTKIQLLFQTTSASAVRGNVLIDSAKLNQSSYLRFFNSRYLGARGVETGIISYRYFASDVLATKKEELLAIGGFDEDFKTYGCEDEELGQRYMLQDKKFYFCREALFIDSDLPTLDRECSRMQDYAQFSFPILMTKHPKIVENALMSIVESSKRGLSRSIVMFSCNYLAAKCIKYFLNKFDGFSIRLPPIFYYYVLASYYIRGVRAR